MNPISVKATIINTTINFMTLQVLVYFFESIRYRSTASTMISEMIAPTNMAVSVPFITKLKKTIKKASKK